MNVTKETLFNVKRSVSKEATTIKTTTTKQLYNTNGI
jgi:hypothetical protein